jgi:hypothetical protein
MSAAAADPGSQIVSTLSVDLTAEQLAHGPVWHAPSGDDGWFDTDDEFAAFLAAIAE